MPDPATMTPEQRRAALGYVDNFARILRREEGRTEFGYDLDPSRWPWLALSPLHPIVLDKIQYFSAVSASLAAESMAPGTRSALTKIGWDCTPRPGGTRHAVLGVLEPFSAERRIGYRLSLRDEDGHENARVSGEGTAFADRDFGAWRSNAKRTAAERANLAPPTPIDPRAAGLGPGGRCFVSAPYAVDGAWAVTAQVGAANGFHPAHPFHTGTGDHVNAAHLFDCALQAAHLLWEPAGTRLECLAGEAEFLRFVELDVPFEIRVSFDGSAGNANARGHFAIRQSDRENTRIALDLQAARPPE